MSTQEPDSENTKLASSAIRYWFFRPLSNKFYLLFDQSWCLLAGMNTECMYSLNLIDNFPFWLAAVCGAMAMPSMASSLGHTWGSRKCFVLKLSQSGQTPADIKWAQGFQEFQRGSLMSKEYLYQKLNHQHLQKASFKRAIRQALTYFSCFQEAFEWSGWWQQLAGTMKVVD